MKPDPVQKEDVFDEKTEEEIMAELQQKRERAKAIRERNEKALNEIKAKKEQQKEKEQEEQKR